MQVRKRRISEAFLSFSSRLSERRGTIASCEVPKLPDEEGGNRRNFKIFATTPSIDASSGSYPLTRDIRASKDTPSAVAELVDSSPQARASRIHIAIQTARDQQTLRVVVVDNGEGMDSGNVRSGIARSGGSSRFDDCRGLGRYRHGTPQAALLSQARQLDVYTWRRPGDVLHSHRNVDAIAAGSMSCVPEPRRAKLPSYWIGSGFTSGTMVVWSQCDRLDHKRASTIARNSRISSGACFARSSGATC